ncbi:iron-containing alcohol dehydrogenase [Streptomyces sp. NPDC002574]|uniref:iron-containing alcohol dehydrogenase n=1 Tax=Streptomyces sp. NPDC002574 TaxID=3364652 RepID=UPI0036CB3F5B
MSDRLAAAATGIDALVHGVESLASLGASPLSAAYAAQAVAMVGRWLPVAHADGSDLETRSHLMLGAHLAGQALTLSGLGLVHGIGHSLTAHTGTPHGVALAAVLEEVMAFNAPFAGPAYEQAARALRLDPPAGGDWSRALIAAVREISGAIGVKNRWPTGRGAAPAAVRRRGSGRRRRHAQQSPGRHRGRGAGTP